MTAKTRKPTPHAVQQALAILERIATPTPRERAELRMRHEKQRFTEAAQLALAGDPGAEDAARKAYAEVEAARAELAQLDAEDATPSSHPSFRPSGPESCAGSLMDAFCGSATA